MGPLFPSRAFMGPLSLVPPCGGLRCAPAFHHIEGVPLKAMGFGVSVEGADSQLEGLWLGD